jgi:hypothetical protein
MIGISRVELTYCLYNVTALRPAGAHKEMTLFPGVPLRSTPGYWPLPLTGQETGFYSSVS